MLFRIRVDIMCVCLEHDEVDVAQAVCKALSTGCIHTHTHTQLTSLSRRPPHRAIRDSRYN